MFDSLLATVLSDLKVYYQSIIIRRRLALFDFYRVKKSKRYLQK